jgi:MerR family transcriptional regulator, light-induced transcriptional regulator
MVDMISTADLDALRRDYVAAQLAGNRRQALEIVANLTTCHGLTASEVRDKIIAASQREIGALWQRNEISIAQEHMATAISHLVLADLFQRDQTARPNGRKVIVACVEHELHDFPARLVADELDVAGFEVRFLGANVPTDTLLSFIAREQPDLLVLSATMAFHAESVRHAVERVQALFPSLPIAVGGLVCEWIRTFDHDLGVAIVGGTSADLVRAATRLLKVTA